MGGALAHLRIVEIAGMGPTPFAAMWFAEQGARVIRVIRPGARHVLGLERDVLDRGRDWVELDLKSADGREVARRLILAADGLIEGMRPGVMEPAPARRSPAGRTGPGERPARSCHGDTP